MRVVVVGAGIAGLAAARELAERGSRVLVLEGSAVVGGKLRLAEVAGLRVDVGAEAMLNRRPEGVALARAAGLDVVHPTAATSRIWSRGALRPMPPSLMGVPRDLEALAAAQVLSADGLERARHEMLTEVGGDLSVGDLVAGRLGEELVDRLVEPLLGGVYAGRARSLSAAATVPQLFAMGRRGPLLEQAAAVGSSDVPVFAGIRGGMGRLPLALAADPRIEVRTGAMVRGLRPEGQGWLLSVGSAHDPDTVRADAVVLATPAAATARLLAGPAPGPAAELARVEAASVAVVTCAFAAEDLGDRLDAVSGFLVPAVEERAVKAATFSFAKWAWVRDLHPGLRVLRTSLGRHGEEATLQATDAELVATSLAELGALAGITARPVDSHVQRWGGGLPQYAVGHLDRVARIRAGLPAGLAVCGAAYDGVGIPAVIASAHRAAASVAPAQ